METWKSVVGYESTHEVSNMGNVRSLDMQLKGRNGGLRAKKGRPLKPYLTKPGYTAVQLRHKDKRHFIHRLVANSFLGAHAETDQVNHINGIKDDNRASNLEWVTPSQNHVHALATGLRRMGGKTNLASRIKVFDSEEILIGSYETVKEAATAVDLKYSTLCSMLHQGYLNYKGYRFEYVNKRVGRARINQMVCISYQSISPSHDLFVGSIPTKTNPASPSGIEH